MGKLSTCSWQALHRPKETVPQIKTASKRRKKGVNAGKLVKCKRQKAVLCGAELKMAPFAEASTERMSDAEVDRESASMPFSDSELAEAFPNAGLVGACGK